jgi:twitching motility protein PilT
MTKAEASDLHLVPGNRPMYRIHGHLSSAGQDVLAPGQALEMIKTLADAKVGARLDGAGDLDFAVHVSDGASLHRFRVNVFSARGERGACLRAIPDRIPSLAELSFPAELGERIVNLNNGLVLVTGVTGSGKTTSIAALLQLLNARGNCRIITIEEPIEYIYPPCGDSIVTQREVGADVPSFHAGLRSGLRQDPDVLLVGEIRDRETASLALSAAETGHLIFGTLHSADAKGSITRLVDLFPAEMHDDIRTQLSMSLRYVVAQHLLPAGAGGRRVLATEVMFANFAVRSAIRQGKFESVDSAIQSGRKDGMWTLDADLRRLVNEKKISLDTARSFAKDPAEFNA